MDVLTFFSTLRPDQVALGALVTFMVLSLIRGWVVPRSVLLDRMRDKDGQISALAGERDDWKRAYHQADASRLELENQNTDLIESGQATTKLLDAMRAHMEFVNPQKSIGG